MSIHWSESSPFEGFVITDTSTCKVTIYWSFFFPLWPSLGFIVDVCVVPCNLSFNLFQSLSQSFNLSLNLSPSFNLSLNLSISLDLSPPPLSRTLSIVVSRSLSLSPKPFSCSPSGYSVFHLTLIWVGLPSRSFLGPVASIYQTKHLLTQSHHSIVSFEIHMLGCLSLLLSVPTLHHRYSAWLPFKPSFLNRSNAGLSLLPFNAIPMHECVWTEKRSTFEAVWQLGPVWDQSEPRRIKEKDKLCSVFLLLHFEHLTRSPNPCRFDEIGRASCRERV